MGNEMRIISKNSKDRYIFTDVNQVEGVETIYLDITDFEKPIWRMLIGYDFETMRAGSDLWERIILRINAYTGEVIEIRQPSTDIGYLYIAEIW